MNTLTTSPDVHVPIPDRERRDHIVAVGDIYFSKNGYSDLDIYRIKDIRIKDESTTYGVDSFDLSCMEWKENDKRISQSALQDYYTLLIGDFDVLMAFATDAANGDLTTIERLTDALMAEKSKMAASMEIVTSRPADEVFALTEAAERIQDKLETIQSFTQGIIEARRNEMEARLNALERQLNGIIEYVGDLHKVLTVMNLYTGKGVAVELLCDGERAAAKDPIHIRQRILFADEEYLADAENGGIDFQEIDKFFKWLTIPRNRDIICPESKCIVAIKPKRYAKYYTSNVHCNADMNAWNKHTIVIIRDGQRLLAVDSDDLELYGTAIPYSDYGQRLLQIAKHYDEIMRDGSFKESKIRELESESKRLGYMYTKYISFLQGLIDNADVFDLSAGRPNLAKGDGVELVYDDENAVGTGRDWETYQREVNSRIRRGTRIIFFPLVEDIHGYRRECGKPSRYYYHEYSKPLPPDAGVYNVDYPNKCEWEKDAETGRIISGPHKGKRLAIFFYPKLYHFGDERKNRKEAWLYDERCVINYDALTVEDIDAFMQDRTQRESFRSWMPILQEARKQILEEMRNEQAFKKSLGWELLRETPSFPQECIEGILNEAVRWWKEKVIFTRPLISDDAKAWRMIKGHAKKIMTGQTAATE